MFLLDIAAVFHKYKVDYAIVGGCAVAIHGILRHTMDVDFVVSLDADNLRRTEESLATLGLVPRLPVHHQQIVTERLHLVNDRNMMAWSFFNTRDASMVVDILVQHDVKEFRIEVVTFMETPLRVIALRDLISMKRAAGRAQDLEDAKNLEKLL